MYIPIGPSKKQLYKIVIALLLLCYILFLGMYKPKAESYTEWDGGGYTGWNAWGSLGIPPGAVSYTMQPWYGKFKNRTGGTLMFQLNYTGPFEIYTVEVFRSSASGFTCDLGDHINYTDNNTQMTTMTVKCPIDFWSDGLVKINIHGWLHSDPGCGIYVGQFATYYTDNVSSTDIQNIINTMNSNTQSLINAIGQRNSDINDIKNNTNDIKNNLNDSSIDSSSGSDFTNNSAFRDSNGLDAIIKAPLNFIQSLTSSTCSAITLTIPYIDAQVSLPCMSTIYTKALGQQLVNLIALVINGVVLYRYCLKILQIVHNAKNPNKDELEVLDL